MGFSRHKDSNGVGILSHHKKIYIDVEGTQIELGHVRITNDDEVLSVWIDHQRMLFVPSKE